MYLVFASRHRPRTFLNCFALELSVFKTKQLRNVLRRKKLDTKPLLKTQLFFIVSVYKSTCLHYASLFFILSQLFSLWVNFFIMSHFFLHDDSTFFSLWFNFFVMIQLVNSESIFHYESTFLHCDSTNLHYESTFLHCSFFLHCDSIFYIITLGW